MYVTVGANIQIFAVLCESDREWERAQRPRYNRWRLTIEGEYVLTKSRWRQRRWSEPRAVVCDGILLCASLNNPHHGTHAV